MTQHAEMEGKQYEDEAEAWAAVARAYRMVEGGTDSPEGALEHMSDLREATIAAVRATKIVIALRDEVAIDVLADAEQMAWDAAIDSSQLAKDTQETVSMSLAQTYAESAADEWLAAADATAVARAQLTLGGGA